jgi:DNA segregation ATPase FtsK/SpoIIIE-like protein
MTRLGKLKKAKVKNINEYNRGKKNRIPYIVVFFDEWASTKKLVGAEAETILSNIANLSRSAGIHFILATQYPKAEIINTTISVNFPWRIAFNMGSGASQSVLGDWGAFGLSPVGRAVLLTMEGQMQIQTPRITNQNVVDVTQEARTGIKMTKNMENIDERDLLEWSINNAGGKLDFQTLINQFKGKVTSAGLLELLKTMDGQIFSVNDVMYRVVNGVGNLPRHMEIAEESGMPEENAEYKIQNAENVPSTVALDTPEPVTSDPDVTPHTCPSCGAQALINPCEYCGKYVEDEHAS